MTIIKMHARILGDHVHVDVFSACVPGAELDAVHKMIRGKNGALIFTLEEWQDIRKMIESQTFGLHAIIEEQTIDATPKEDS
jgi:hypothetical protein